MRLLVVLAGLALGAVAHAEDAPEDVITYRGVTMGLMGRHNKAVKMIVNGDVAYKDDLVPHAEALVALGKNLGEQFPAGSGPDSGKETEALATIWSNAKGFDAAVKAYQTAAAALLEAAREGDLAKAAEARGDIGKSCGGCHDDFRKDDDH